MSDKPASDLPDFLLPDEPEPEPAEVDSAVPEPTTASPEPEPAARPAPEAPAADRQSAPAAPPPEPPAARPTPEPERPRSAPQTPASPTPEPASAALEDGARGRGPELADVDRASVSAEISGSFDEELSEEEQLVAKQVKEFFVVFLKTVRASQLYVQGNPLLHKFVEELHERLSKLWVDVNGLAFSILENQIRWNKHVVYQGKTAAQENLAFQLYKDGIRRLDLLPGVEEHEVRQFIDVLRLARTLQEEEEDLLTLMWNADFQFIRYEYVDVLGDEPPLPQTGGPEDITGELPTLPELEISPEMQAPTLREDFEPSLYFLDEGDVAHLQQELLRESGRPVKRDVTVAILDQYEMGDLDRRGEIVGILRQMLPRVLAEGNFGDAAFVIAELEGIAKKREDQTDIAEQVEDIVRELSEPMVLQQLVRVLDDGSIDPNSEELATLLGALRPEAIETLIQAMETITRPEAKERLLETMDRLASKNPGLMAKLVRAEDPRVAAETARIAARLKMAGTAEAIVSLLKRPSPDVRLAAIESLVSLRTSQAGSALLGALSDSSREVRVAAARGLAELQYHPAASDLEAQVKGKELLKRDLTEQLVLFEAYALTAGDEGVQVLGRMLNGRRYLWVKYPSRTRACAARALGMVGGPVAQEALKTAEGDKDPMVMSAIHTARRGREEGD